LGSLVDAADQVDGQRHDVVDVAAHQPFEAVADADDFDAFEAGANRRRADHAVDAGRRSSADENGEAAVRIGRGIHRVM
jgi:hypothetical protein